MANSKVIVKDFDLTPWVKANWTSLSKDLEDIADDLLEEAGGSTGNGYAVEASDARKSRPIVNIKAQGEAGWKEHTKGGPLTKIAAMRKRIKGALKPKGE